MFRLRLRSALLCASVGVLSFSASYAPTLAQAATKSERVPDLAAAVARLKAAGSRVLNEPRIGAGGHRYVFVHPASTGGVLLELVESR